MKAGGLPTSGEELGLKIANVAAKMQGPGNGYVNLNVTIGKGGGVTTGLMVDTHLNIHPYLGPAVVSSSGWAVTVSRGQVTPGWNAAVWGAWLPNSKMGLGAARSYNFQTGSWSALEYGGGTRGWGGGVFYVW